MATANMVHRVAGLKTIRKSPRNYTHATVVTIDPAFETTRLMPKSIKWEVSQAAQNWDWNAKVAAMNAGDVLFPRLVGMFGSKTAGLATEDDVVKARTFIAANPDRAAHIAAAESRVRAAFAKITKHQSVIAWHMSLKSAHSFASSKRIRENYAAAEVVETIRTVK